MNGEIKDFFKENDLIVGDRLRRGIQKINGEGRTSWFWNNSQLGYFFGCYCIPENRILAAAFGSPWKWDSSTILIISEVTGDILWFQCDKKFMNPHEARITPRNTLLIPCCFGDRVYEINGAGHIVWQWFAADHFSRPERYVEGRSNWTHINDSIPLKNGNILVSLRNFSTIVEVNRLTGEKVWEWGQGNLSYQHRLQELEDGDLMIADSENNRIIQISRDGTLKWEFKLGCTDWCRSGVRIGDLTIIASSRWNYERRGNGLFGNSWISDDWILIVDKEKEILWKHHFPNGYCVYSVEPCPKVTDEKKLAFASGFKFPFANEKP